MPALNKAQSLIEQPAGADSAHEHSLQIDSLDACNSEKVAIPRMLIE
jgi:hypothetical protein